MEIVGKQNRSPALLDWLFAVGLVAAVFLVYHPCWLGGFLWDDDTHLLNNPVLAPGGLAKVWVPGGYLNYWPLTYTAYWLQFHLWGLQPLGFHLVNLALHAIAALLVWRVLVRLEVPGAMLAAALFALHPVSVDTAAWIAHLKDILSLTLALASMLFYLDSERYASRWRYALAVAAFLLSALAKGTALMLPVVLLACAWWRRGRIERRDLLRVMPYFLIGVLAASVEVWTQHSVAADVVVRSDGFLSRLAVAGCALWFYIGKLIWPLDLCPFYPRWAIDERNVFSYLPGLIWLTALGLAWWKRRSWGRPMVMLLVCYTALLLPALGFVNVYFMKFSLVSDHWQYIAMIVPCAVLAGVTTTLGRRLLPRPAAISAAMALLLVLGVLTFQQSRIYRDSGVFYETIVARNPDSWLAQNNLGNELLGVGDVDLAISHFQIALELSPKFADAHNNLGNALRRRGQIDSAIDEYQQALDINPAFAEAHSNLGALLADRGQIDSAIAHYRRALEFMPGFAEAHNNLGLALLRHGEIDAGIDEYRKALEINPDYSTAHDNLANALLARGQFDSAVVQYQKALELRPDDVEVRKTLARVLASRGQIGSAISDYQAALALNSNDADAQFGLANLLAGHGQVDAAVSHYQKAVEINPSYVAAHGNLASVLAGRGDFDSAILHYQKALEINPGYGLARQNLAVVVAERAKLLMSVSEKRESIRLHPNDASLLNQLAWTLATNPNESVRSGDEAVEFAERATKLTGGDQPTLLNTLAAAYAEVGRFPDAVRTAEQAEQLASAAGDRTLAAQIHSRLELYRGGKAYREAPNR